MTVSDIQSIYSKLVAQNKKTRQIFNQYILTENFLPQIQIHNKIPFFLHSYKISYVYSFSQTISIVFQLFSRRNNFISPIILAQHFIDCAMTSIQTRSATLALSEFHTPCKIDSSVGTEATSGDLFKKKVSLCCSSSVSLEQMLESSDEKELFAKYLVSLGTKRERESFENLRNKYEAIQHEEQKASEKIVDLRKSEGDANGEILSHFLGVWLKHMGYGTQKTKNYLQGRAKLFLGGASLHSFVKLYQDLNQLRMGQAEKQFFLLETCSNGWQFFIQEIGRRKLLSLSSDSIEVKQQKLFHK